MGAGGAPACSGGVTVCVCVWVAGAGRVWGFRCWEAMVWRRGCCARFSVDVNVIAGGFRNFLVVVYGIKRIW